MRIANVPFYPAHSSNYTKGRGRPLRKLTIHHTAANNNTLRHLWADPTRNGSSNFFVSASAQEQYVDTDDTPWTNGNFSSNQESITIEVNGDWRNGYYNQATLNNLEDLCKKILRHYPSLVIEYHMDVSAKVTLCPADLKHKGWAAQVWKNAKAALAPAPTPATPAPPQKTITYSTEGYPKRVELNKVTRLWDFNATSWTQINNQAIGEPYPEGWVVDAVAEATNQLGSKYLMTAYSYDSGKIRYTRGFNEKDTRPHVIVPVPVPQPPVEQPMPEVPPEVIEPPIDTDPDTVGNSDIEKRLTALETAVKFISDFLSSIFSGFKK